jgi:hypothetical protein
MAEDASEYLLPRRTFPALLRLPDAEERHDGFAALVEGLRAVREALR